MTKIRIAATVAALVATTALTGIAVAQDVTYDKTFFADYSKLKQKTNERTNGGGRTELMYIAPGALEKLSKYTGVMVDQPEVSISAQSDYKGAKPDDLKAIAEAMRNGGESRLKAGGYTVVDTPGPGILYVRMALTDLQLTKKKRGLLAYTPVGAVVKFGTDALKNVTSKYDIMNMTLQMEISDSQTNAALAQFVLLRGGGDKPVRIDFDKLEADITEFGERLRCRLDNAHAAAGKQVDCLDPAARAARENAAAK